MKSNAVSVTNRMVITSSIKMFEVYVKMLSDSDINEVINVASKLQEFLPLLINDESTLDDVKEYVNGTDVKA